MIFCAYEVLLRLFLYQKQKMRLNSRRIFGKIMGWQPETNQQALQCYGCPSIGRTERFSF